METLSLYPERYRALRAERTLTVSVTQPKKFRTGTRVLVAEVSPENERDTNNYLMTTVKQAQAGDTGTLLTLVAEPQKEKTT